VQSAPDGCGGKSSNAVFVSMQGGQPNQSSTLRPGTRRNSRVLCLEEDPARAIRTRRINI